MENKKNEDFSAKHDPKDQTEENITYYSKLKDYFEGSVGSSIDKLENFPKYVPRQALTRFISKYEIFKRVLDIQGAIVECGVFHGGGLMTFAQLSAIFEPINHQRQIIGFDTFSGFPDISQADKDTGTFSNMKPGEMSADSYGDLIECVKLYDMNRFVGHMERVELVKGDVCKTLPDYVESNPHLVVSLLYLDFDLYQPTKVALEHLLPRIPKGGIIAFDELNSKSFPGETIAVMEEIGISSLKIERMSFDSCISYAVID